jgi:UDP-N-acetylmuramyl pentapeptide phosphotransferase/UDP-N-acetylglucosamine-1-phosphate transferase
MNRHEHDGRVWTRRTRREPREARAAGGRGQNRPVRFWIITIMLVLVGLSTLKIR